MILVHKETVNGTASSGTFSVNTNPLRVSGMLHLITIKPTTSSTQYDFKIVDEDSFTIYERTSEIGALSEEVRLPLRGVYTVTISNSTIDEAFNIKLHIVE